MTTWLTRVCSEREAGGPWADCTFASAVMMANEAYGARKYPQTRTEYEALRAASGRGPTGGTNIGDVMAGMTNRYGWTGRELVGAAMVAAVPVGTALVVQGTYSALPERLQRWGGGFAGAHAVCVVRTEAGWWWLDPLATSEYPGEPIIATALRAFIAALPGARALAVTVGERKVQLLTLVDKTARLVDTSIGAKLIAMDGTVLTTVKSGERDIASSAALSGLHYAVIVSIGGVLQLAAIKASDCTNVRTVGVGPVAVPTSAYNDGVTAASVAALTARK